MIPFYEAIINDRCSKCICHLIDESGEINAFRLLEYNFECLPATSFICEQLSVDTLKEIVSLADADEYYVVRAILYHARNRGKKYIAKWKDESLDDEEKEIIKCYYETHKDYSSFKKMKRYIKEILRYNYICYDEDVIREYYRNMIIIETATS